MKPPRSARRAFIQGAGAFIAAQWLPPAAAAPGDSGIEVLAGGLQGGEGPTALSDGGFACVQFIAGDVLRIGPDGAKSSWATIGFGTAGTALGPDGALYIAKMSATSMGPPPADQPAMPAPAGLPAGGIFRLDLRTHAVTPLYLTGPDGAALVGPNDLVFDAHGDLWFSDFAQGQVYWARSDGSEIRLVVAQLPGANGIALSPDRRTLYVVQSRLRQVAVFPISGRGQLAMNLGKRFGPFESAGDFDGMKTEANGNLVVAAWAGGLFTISPVGRVLARMPFPGRQVINLSFCGAGLRHIVCVANGASIADGAMLRVAWPRPGLALRYG